MHIVVVGLNHRTAPVELRERLTFRDTTLPRALRILRGRPSVSEAVVLSTCNRTEIYAAVDHVDHGRGITQFLSEFHNIPVSDFAEHVYVYHDVEAIRQLFRVASGLDSLVLGEPQIVRQVRDAFASAAEAECTGTLTDGLFRSAIATARRARTETNIGKGGFSVGHAAVDLARSIFGTLGGTTVLVLGAGKMSELTARHLVAAGAKFVLVANRTHEKAVQLAERLGGRAIRYDDFPETMATADVVISSTAAPHHVVTRQTLTPVLRKRRGHPLFLIDIAVPRDIEPAVADMENVFLYDIDDLQDVVSDMARERGAEALSATAIVDEETQRFAAWWRSLDAGPLASQLAKKQNEIRAAELQRLHAQLGDVSDRDWAHIEAATRTMMNRVLREAITRLKHEMAEDSDEATYTLADAARELFGLHAPSNDHNPLSEDLDDGRQTETIDTPVHIEEQERVETP